MSSVDNPQAPAQIVLGYLNSQLATKHVTATKWFNLYGKDDKDYEDHRNLFAWAWYRHPVKGQDDNAVEFAFSEPSLSFICDHDARLDIKIESMDRVRGEDATRRGVLCSYEPQFSANENVFYSLEQGARDIIMSFRVAATLSSFVAEDKKVGDHKSRIHLLVCDFDSARIINPTRVTVTDEAKLRWEIERYLLSYLKTLQRGGHHAFFFPPAFPEVNKRSIIRFSSTSIGQVPLDRIVGCTADMVNGYLSLLWYICAFTASERGKVWDTSSSLAGFSSWLFPDFEPEDWHVSLKFGEPTVTIVCDREAMLCFALAEVRFYRTSELETEKNGAEKEPDYHNWRISLIVDITASRTGISVEAESARHVGSSPELSEVSKEHRSAHKMLMHFFELYFKRVAATRLKYLFRRIQAEPIPVDPPAEDDMDRSTQVPRHTPGRSSNEVSSSNIKDATMSGFDVVVAVSQLSINAQILRMFNMHESALRWVQGDSESFNIEVKAVTVRLLDFEEVQEDTVTDATMSVKAPAVAPYAIITVHVARATLKEIFKVTAGELVSEPIDELHVLQDCQLAFEVEVKSEDPKVKSDARSHPDTPHGDGDDPKTPASGEDYNLRRIYLDLKNGRFSSEYSPWADAEYVDQKKIRARMTLAKRIKDHYFPQLLESEVHLLASVPIYNETTVTGFGRLTDMWYRTFAAEVTEGGFTSEGSRARLEQILFVLGAVGGNRLPPLRSFKPSTSWLVHGVSSHGVLALSRQAFRNRLLPLLANINALTTLIPIPPEDIESRPSKHSVQQWAKHPGFKSKVCKWGSATVDEDMNSNNCQWVWSDVRPLQAHGTLSSMEQDYLIFCETRNELEFPDNSISGGPLKIRMWGITNLEISDKCAPWITKASAKWSIVIDIKRSDESVRGSVKVEVSEFDYHIDDTSPPEMCPRTGTPNASATLHSHRLVEENLDDILGALRELQGEWKHYFPASVPFTLCNPMSNPGGDLVFELRHS